MSHLLRKLAEYFGFAVPADPDMVGAPLWAPRLVPAERRTCQRGYDGRPCDIPFTDLERHIRAWHSSSPWRL